MAVKLNWNAELLTELHAIWNSGEEPPGTEDFLDENGQWQCTRCGACCEDVRWCLEDWMVEGTTRCKNLRTDKGCKIYHGRPWICKMSSAQATVDQNPRTVAAGCAYMRTKFYGSPSESE